MAGPLGLGNPGLPYAATWRLNERHCGALEGLEKAAAEARFGKEAVEAWRRERDAPPPRLAPDDPRHPANDPRYAGCRPASCRRGESLGQVIDRLRPSGKPTCGPASGRAPGSWWWARGLPVGAPSLLAGPGLPRFPLPNANPLVVELGPGLSLAGLRYLDPARALPLP